MSIQLTIVSSIFQITNIESQILISTIKLENKEGKLKKTIILSKYPK